MTTARELIDLLTPYPPDTQVVLHSVEGAGYNDLGAAAVVRIAKAGEVQADGNQDPVPLDDVIAIARSSAGRLHGSPPSARYPLAAPFLRSAMSRQSPARWRPCSSRKATRPRTLRAMLAR